MSESLPQVEIYTDGGAEPNPGAGGWGAILIFRREGGEIIEKELSGGALDTTNNRMELTAAIEALNALRHPCQVDLYTDSQYLKNGISSWIHTWKAKKWRDVKNVELWQALDLAIQRHQIRWKWVKGHAGNKYNERADQLATAARPKVDPASQHDQTRTQVYLQLSGPADNKTGAGGWAAAVLAPNAAEPTYYGGHHPKISPNHLGVFAAGELLKQLPAQERLQLYCDNGFLIDGITQWVAGWRANNWTKDIKFKPDWQRLDQLTQGRDIHWVKDKGADADLLKALKQMAREQRSMASGLD